MHNATNCVNANKATSRRANHAYVIKDGNGNVLKYGISSGRISAAGLSYRATRQVNKFNKNNPGLNAHAQVVAHFPNRSRALKWELAVTQSHINQFGGRPPFMQRP